MEKIVEKSEIESLSKGVQTSSLDPNFKLRNVEKATTLKLVGKDPELIGDILIALTTDFSVRTTSDLRFSKSSDEWFVFALIDRREGRVYER